MAGLQTDWQVLYTMPKSEKKILEELKSLNIEAYLPLYKKKRIWRNRNLESTLPLFPGYIFLKAPQSSIGRVLKLAGVIRFLKNCGKLSLVTHEEILRIKAIEEVNGTLEPVSHQERGKPIVIQEGALQGIKAEVLEEGGAARILIDLLSLRERYALRITDERLIAYQA